MNHSELEFAECEPYSEWLSASIDGELGARELAMLTEHLAGCSACEALLDALQNVDNIAIDAICYEHVGEDDTRKDFAAALEPVKQSIHTLKVNGHSKTENENKTLLKSTHKRSWRTLAKRLIPIAVAASVVAGMFFVEWSPPKQANAEVVQPLVEVNEINMQLLRDQQRSKEIMELKLRVLRLELLLLDDHELANSYSSKIEELFLKIKQVD